MSNQMTDLPMHANCFIAFKITCCESKVEIRKTCGCRSRTNLYETEFVVNTKFKVASLMFRECPRLVHDKIFLD